jgi:hypothetical protein
MGKTAQICCYSKQWIMYIYVCKKNGAARPDPAPDADPEDIFVNKCS